MNSRPEPASIFLLLPFLHFGIGRLVIDLVESLCRLGIRCHVVTCGTAGDLRDDHEMLARLAGLEASHCEVDIFSRNPALMARASEIVARLWRDHEPLLAHAFTAPAAAAALECGPVVASVVGWGPLKQEWQKRQDVDILHRCTLVTAVSGAMLSEVNQAGLKRTDIRLIRNGIAIGRAEEQKPNAITRIGVMAQLIARKGVDVLLNALPELRPPGAPLELVIAGTGEAEEELKLLAANSQACAQVVWAGQQPVDEFLAHVDLLVVPSRSDALPMVLLQGMSRGLPIVASKVGGIPEAIQSEMHGLLVPPDNPSALANAINRFLADPEMSRRCGRNARLRAVQQFSVEEMIRGYLAAYFTISGHPSFAAGCSEPPGSRARDTGKTSISCRQGRGDRS
jgi:glycosyltransferase involved in cell wall biosynthesis